MRGGRLFSRRDVELQTNAHADTIKDHIVRFERGGYIQQVDQKKQSGKGGRMQYLYRLLKPVRTAPRLTRDGTHVTQGQGNEHMWRSMKMLGTFDPKTLAIAASTDDCQVEQATAVRYIRHLFKAGYLQQISAPLVTGPAKDRKQATYKLKPKMNTGPQPPKVKRIHQVYDPNIDKVVWAGGDDE